MAKEVNENQEVVSPRDKVRSRLASRFPDRNFMGADGTDDTDAIDSSLDEMMSEYETREAEYNEQSKRLTDLFASNPRAALQSDEGRNKFIDAQKKWLAKRSEAEKADKEAEENFAKSVETLKAFQAENNLSDEEAIAVFDMVQKIGKDMVMGIYEPESLMMAYKAMKHDKDVSDARTEGEIAGRNTRIKEQMRKGDNLPPLPPALGGQGGSAAPARPKTQQRTALDMFGIRK